MATSRMRRRTLWGAVALLAVTAPGCTKVDNTLAKVPIFAFMHDAPFFDPYEHPLPAPPGAVPYLSPAGEVLPPLEGTDPALQAFAASELGRNPLAADDPAALALGQTMYDRHCFVCHGPRGEGDGPLVGENKYPQGFVPPLTRGTALGLSDGYLYGIIRAGRGRMPSYGPRTTHIERWAIVNYVRQLQGGAAGAVPQPGAAVTGQAPQSGAVAPAPAPQTDTTAAADTARTQQ